MKKVLFALLLLPLAVNAQNFNYPPPAKGAGGSVTPGPATSVPASGVTGLPGTDSQVFYNSNGTWAAATGLVYNSPTAVTSMTALNVVGASTLTSLTATARTMIGSAATPSSTLHLIGTNAQTGGLTIASNAGTVSSRMSLYGSGNFGVSFQLSDLNGGFNFLSADGKTAMKVVTVGGNTNRTVVGDSVSAYTPTKEFEVVGTVSATFARLSSSTTACATTANIGDMVRVPSRNSIGICTGALAVSVITTVTTPISPSVL